MNGVSAGINSILGHSYKKKLSVYCFTGHPVVSLIPTGHNYCSRMVNIGQYTQIITGYIRR